MWQDNYISKRDNYFVCWTREGEFIAECKSKALARTEITNFKDFIGRKMNKIKGIVLDEENLVQIRACGFTDFRVLGDEMHYDDEPKYQDWCNEKQDEIELVSDEYMVGMEDAKLFFFSDKPAVIAKIAKTFPGCELITVTEKSFEDTYTLDYDYRNE